MLILIGMALLSMGDFYFPAISGAPFPVIGAGLIWFSSQTFHRPRLLEVVLATLFLFGIVVGLVRVFSDPAVKIWPTNLAGWLVGLFLLLTDLRGKEAEIRHSIALLLTAHASLFYCQGLAYYLSGNYIDVVGWVTGEPSRYMAEDITTYASLFSIRPTGAFLEPSNYAAHVLPLALIYYMDKGRASPVVLAAVASVALTFSSWAFVAVGLSLILFINKRLGRSAIIVVAFIVLASTFSDWFITRTFEMRYDSGETPAEFRWIFAKAVFDDAVRLSPGLGIGVRDAGLGVLDSFTINDSGAAVFFFYVFGGYALLLIFALLWCTAGWRHQILLIIVLSSKLTPTYPFFWLMINLITRRFNPAPAAQQAALGSRGDPEPSMISERGRGKLRVPCCPGSRCC